MVGPLFAYGGKRAKKAKSSFPGIVNSPPFAGN